MSKIDLKDYVYSDCAASHNLDNSLPECYRENAERTIERFNALLTLFGEFRLTSGYRCPIVNDLVGGVIHSKHMEALAVDFVPLETPSQLVLSFVKLLPCVTYAYTSNGYIHVSFL